MYRCLHDRSEKPPVHRLRSHADGDRAMAFDGAVRAAHDHGGAAARMAQADLPPSPSRRAADRESDTT